MRVLINNIVAGRTEVVNNSEFGAKPSWDACLDEGFEQISIQYGTRLYIFRVSADDLATCVVWLNERLLNYSTFP